MTDSIWFHWERNATFTPIFMCMEAWAQPTTAYWGVAWPTSICVWKNDVISWNNKNQDFYEMGQFIVEKLLRDGWENLEVEVHATARKIDIFLQRCASERFSEASLPDLIQRFGELHALYLHWFVLGVTEPPGVYGEKLLEQRTSDKKIFSLLTSPTRKSFSRKELEELLRVRDKAGLAAHAQKYSWLHNNYFTTETLGLEFFESEWKKLLERYPDSESYLQELDIKDRAIIVEKEKAMDTLHFSDRERRLVALMEFFAWFQDYRKEYTMRMLHTLDRLLEAIGKYHGLSLKEMKHALPSEILENALDRARIHARLRHLMVIWDSEHQQFQFYVEDKAIESKKTELLGEAQHAREIIEIEGQIANPGRVKGKAFVTMNARDAARIQAGEILVTSMTSPDFIVAIKRAAAIVTNEGGILCHAAVISREFGIPCIVGTQTATRTIKTGDLIEVDGTHGFVRILKGPVS